MLFPLKIYDVEIFLLRRRTQQNCNFCMLLFLYRRRGRREEQVEGRDTFVFLFLYRMRGEREGQVEGRHTFVFMCGLAQRIIYLKEDP
jgi:hypothetical protein